MHAISGRHRPILAAAAVTMVVASALTLTTATAANAIDGPAEFTNQNVWNNYVLPAVESGDSLDLGDLTVTLKPGAKATDLRPIASVTVAPGALPVPEGYNVQGQEQFLMDNTYVVASDPYLRRDAKAAGRGLDGNPVNFTDSNANPIAGYDQLSNYDGYTESGYFRYVVSISSTNDQVRPHAPGVAFYDAILYWNKTTNELSVYTGNTTPSKTATQTVAAASATQQTSTTLTATVTPAAATGTVEFKNGDLVVGSGTVTNGQAGASISGLTPNTDYTITANYSGDATHEASSGTVAFKTEAEPSVPPADTADTDVKVTVPPVEATNPSGLKISTAPATSIALTGTTPTRAAEAVWTAAGQLGEVTVNDDRRQGTGNAWSLTGSASAFAREGGNGSIAASELSWTPTKVSGAGTAGTAGAITSAKTLATGDAPSTTANVETKVSAGLSLNVPANTPDGNYTSKLTLTLI